jgi:superfamily I DNA/RNA helicase
VRIRARSCCARFRHVLVDEYQDTNRLQASVLLALKPDGCGLTVVGDDAQSIYAFRGATVRGIPQTSVSAGAGRSGTVSRMMLNVSE